MDRIEPVKQLRSDQPIAIRFRFFRGLDRLINQSRDLLIREEDILVVWRLDRLGRSLKDLIKWVEWFDENKIGFKSLHESINTSTSTGKLVFHIFGALAEFEKNLTHERSRAGIEAARARGR